MHARVNKGKHTTLTDNRQMDALNAYQLKPYYVEITKNDATPKIILLDIKKKLIWIFFYNPAHVVKYFSG